ncbi:MAG: site-specific DNA-methyltransferase, partial [Elusimicrobiota bacterium]|nr:site-specific DNA-methyltransferase [Elusimicrobiota bacterium]
MQNSLILGDNLEILKTIDSNSIDLIYLDPPFFSNRNYEVIWGDAGEVRSFKDRWAGGISHYIDWLNERVKEMYRILKQTGSIFLHCDWHASHYIKTQILDRLFDYENFRGEIIWKRTHAKNDAIKKLTVLTDSIFYYSKTRKFTYIPIFVELREQYVKSAYNLKDERGQYQAITLTGAGINKNDIEWKGYHPAKSGRHYAIPKEIIKNLAGEAGDNYSSIEKLELLEKNGYIVWSANGVPRLKQYLDNTKG